MRLLTAVVLILLQLTALHGQAPASWLDRSLTNWNAPGTGVPAAPAGDESVAAVTARCKLAPLESTAARALSARGWIAFRPFDQQLVRNDVEIVGGMRGADGMCRPILYNLFVFVAGRFAGTLSPAVMTSRLDSSAGVIRMRPPELTTEFERYTSTDPLCCPSSRVTVTYRIDRLPVGAVVVPVRVVTTRGQ